MAVETRVQNMGSTIFTTGDHLRNERIVIEDFHTLRV